MEMPLEYWAECQLKRQYPSDSLLYIKEHCEVILMLVLLLTVDISRGQILYEWIVLPKRKTLRE